jgi:hypothetical protein
MGELATQEMHDRLRLETRRVGVQIEGEEPAAGIHRRAVARERQRDERLTILVMVQLERDFDAIDAQGFYFRMRARPLGWAAAEVLV